MAKKGGDHVVRNAAIVGAGLATAAATAALSVRYRQNRQAVQPTMEVTWGAHAPTEQAPIGESADFEGHGRKRLRGHLAVLAFDGTHLDKMLQERPSRAGIAVEDSEGLWQTGVLPENAAFLASHENPATHLVAVRLGNKAMVRNVHVGTVDENGGFEALPQTDIKEVGQGRDIARAYAGIPVLAGPPEELQMQSEPRTTEVVPGNGLV